MHATQERAGERRGAALHSAQRPSSSASPIRGGSGSAVASPSNMTLVPLSVSTITKQRASSPAAGDDDVAQALLEAVVESVPARAAN